jgi:hypothetical protein
MTWWSLTSEDGGAKNKTKIEFFKLVFYPKMASLEPQKNCIPIFEDMYS